MVFFDDMNFYFLMTLPYVIDYTTPIMVFLITLLVWHVMVQGILR